MTMAREPSADTSARIRSIDALRGVIMILMALDHVRDYTSSAAMSFSPTDLSRTTAALFFTRWITHFCAPVFAFTAGAGAFFWLHRSRRTRGQLSRFLLTRGLWLMLVEVTILRFIFFFQWQIRGGFFILTVLWMLGLSMVILAALIHLPGKLLLVLSLVVIAGHNLLDPIQAQQFGRAAWLWEILHQQGLFLIGSGSFLVAYPLLPWVAVMAVGFCFGRVLLWEPERRQRFLLRLGLALSALFVLLRAWNHYGDPFHWSTLATHLFTFLSFLNTTKYPPSLAFLLMTLGPAQIALSQFDRWQFSTSHPFIVFGRVPFFFFLFHLAVGHLLAVILEAIRFGPHLFVIIPPPSLGGAREQFPPSFGFSLPVVYAAWLVVILISYPVCRWYADLKRRRPDLWYLSYL
jgi:uncharacterized membrane protein